MCKRCEDDECLICSICGKGKCEHHTFVAVEKPKGCICDHNDWRHPDKIPPVCNEYSGDGYENCDSCEHDKECHKKG